MFSVPDMPRPAAHGDIRLSAMGLEFLDLGLGSEQRDYQATWDLQRAIHAEVSAGTRPDTVLLLEHASVYTAGSGPSPRNARSMARPWSMLTEAARSPGTGRVS
jgi:hypothetical protein